MLKENIKRIRESNHISQRELARKINMSGQMISKIERGETTPSIETLNKIAKALGVTPNTLLKGTKTLSRELVDALEYPLIKLYGVIDTLEILSDKLKIDYNLLNDSINKNIELPIDIQIKLLEFLFKIDYYGCMKFIDENEDELLHNTTFKNKINEIYMKKLIENSNASFEMFKKYLLITFGNKIMEFSNDDDLKEIQQETDKYLEFALYKMEKKYYGEDDEDNEDD